MFWVCYPPTLWQIVINFAGFFSEGFPNKVCSWITVCCPKCSSLLPMVDRVYWIKHRIQLKFFFFRNFTVWHWQVPLMKTSSQFTSRLLALGPGNWEIFSTKQSMTRRRRRTILQKFASKDPTEEETRIGTNLRSVFKINRTLEATATVWGYEREGVTNESCCCI